jgi:hypothetical protein
VQSQKYLSLFVLIVLSACSVLQKEDREAEVREFLAGFQKNMSQPDAVILSQFKVEQSSEGVLELIRLFQNKDAYIKCEPMFEIAEVLIGDDQVDVQLPIALSTKGLEKESATNVTLHLGLKKEGKRFIITQLDGDVVYQKYLALKNENEWEIDRMKAEEMRRPIYAKAAQLEANFDSVIFYAPFQGKVVFYVVEGNWLTNPTAFDDSQPSPDVQMGVVDEFGMVIVPMDYDQVGTLGFNNADYVEVMRDGKFGLFDIAQQIEVIPPVYDMLIPSSAENMISIAKSDSGYVYFDTALQIHALTEEMLNYVQRFEYLGTTITISPEHYSLCEIPRIDYAGDGILMPPSYLVRNGIFRAYEADIKTTDVPIAGWTVYKEKKKSIFETISDNVKALVTSVQSRYVDGREEFYTESKVVFLNSAQDTIGHTAIGGEMLSFTRIDSTLFQIAAPADWWFMEGCPCGGESNVMVNNYFRISTDGTIKRLTSDRLFSETEFVKLDSTYITGDFTYYDPEIKAQRNTDVLTLATLTYMRNEILAANGFKFTTEVEKETFGNSKWYQPRFNTVDEAKAVMSEIDRHNIVFLERVIASYHNASA